jgi:Flp pilus assembly pilin Flp
MWLRARQFAHDSGQALIEYALILALASLGIVSALILLQRSLGNTMQGTSQQIDAAASSSPTPVLPGEPSGGATAPGGAGSAGGNGAGHGNGKGNSGNGYGNGGPNGRK